MYGSLSDPSEIERLGIILVRCFNSPDGYWTSYRDRIGVENFRAIRCNGNIAGGLGLYRMGQWFGGRRVSLVGISAVGIAPEYRGKGVAAELLRQTLRELHDDGISLSTLYPATQTLYRKVGYEQGGNRCVWEVPLQRIAISDFESPVEAVPVEIDSFEGIYRQFAPLQNGYIDRSSANWQNLFDCEGKRISAYRVGEASRPEGYIILAQSADAQESDLNVRDWVTLTPAAGRRLWSLVATHRSMASQVRWEGRFNDPLLLLLPEQTATLSETIRWCARVVNVERALTERGYPSHLNAELHLDVSDELFADNCDRFILSVSDGRGSITRGGRGELALGIGALASLYTGLYSPWQLKLTGHLDGSDRVLETAASFFAASEPAMSDFF